MVKVLRDGRIRPLAFALLVATPVLAQEIAPDAQKVERIEVTGSNIPRADGETALPLQTITRNDIQRSGVTTAAELLSHISANVNGRNDALGIGANPPFAGLTSANLRGIGDGSTLVLLNGRRLANYAFEGGTVDLGSIPLAAVERVEILKDGASAIYGTDAIGGVINFILRKDFRGAEISGNLAETEHGGARHRQLTVTGGLGNRQTDRFNAFVTVDYQQDSALPARDRPFARTALILSEGVNSLTVSTFPANILFDDRVLNPALASGCAPPTSLPTTFDYLPGNPVCAFDYATAIDILPPTERVSVVGRATFQLSADHQLFAEYVYASNRIVYRIAPTPAAQYFTFNGDPILYPAGGPYYPTAFAAANGISGDLNLFYRAIPLGPRIDRVNTEAQRLVVGADGVVHGWSYSAALSRSENTSRDNYVSGFVSERQLIAAMATGLINPFGPSGPDADSLLAATQIHGELHHAKGTTDSIDAKISNDIVKLPAGPLALALGVEARREAFDDIFAPVWSSGDILAGGGQDQSKSASRKVQSAFVEMNVPVSRALEAQFALRFDHYSDVGNTTNPKVALRWQPAKTWLFRASYGTGFRAPTLFDIFTPLSKSTTNSTFDPERCPVTQLPGDCITGFNSLVGGNPNLKPEESEQFNVGVVWEPIDGLSLSVDRWKIDKRRTIGDLSETTLFQFYEQYKGTHIIRGPVDPAYPNLPGPILFIVLPTENLGNLRTSGLDVDLRYRSPRTRFGKFTLSINGTYVEDWRQQLNGVNYTSGVGRNVNGAIPRWHHFVALDWDYASWSATLGQNFVSGYIDANPDLIGNERRVGAYETWDAQSRYSGFKNLMIVVGIRNLLDRAPPFSNQLNTMQVGYDPTYTDARGRVYYGTLTYSFN